MKTHYVNNAEFLVAMKAHRKAVEEAKANDAPLPQVSNYIGECILKIAQHISYKPNFINYSYKDEMISDGVLNCIQYVNNFDPEKSSNPFAYFSQIIHFAFIRRLGKEKKQTLVKGKLLLDAPFDEFDVQAHDEGDGSFANSYADFLRSCGVYNEMVAHEEAKTKTKAKKTEDPSIESILDEGV